MKYLERRLFHLAAGYVYLQQSAHRMMENVGFQEATATGTWGKNGELGYVQSARQRRV